MHRWNLMSVYTKCLWELLVYRTALFIQLPVDLHSLHHVTEIDGSEYVLYMQTINSIQTATAEVLPPKGFYTATGNSVTRDGTGELVAGITFYATDGTAVQGGGNQGSQELFLQPLNLPKNSSIVGIGGALSNFVDSLYFLYQQVWEERCSRNNELASPLSFCLSLSFPLQWLRMLWLFHLTSIFWSATLVTDHQQFKSLNNVRSNNH